MNSHSPAVRVHWASLELGLIGVAATAAVFVGLTVATGHGRIVTVVLATSVAVVLGLSSWRRSLYALLIYIPVSGVPIIMSYPDTQIAVLLKDMLFVMPAYIGFLAWASANRVKITFSGAPMVLMVLFAIIVFGQALNPSLPNLLVGAIGVKVWLFYIPLYFLGYHMIRGRADLYKLLAVISLVAALPATVGLVEATLLYAGSADRVYDLYGDAAAAATQNFAQFAYAGGATLRRVPSTFSFVAQYYAFLATMVAITYAWWRMDRRRNGHQALRCGVWLLVLLASFLSGARIAFLLVPALVAVIVLLERPVAPKLRIIAAPVIAFGAAASVFGASGLSVIGSTLDTARTEFVYTVVNGFKSAFSMTALGLGTGVDTNASRYAYSSPDLFPAVGGAWYESWYVKVFLELGIPGLIVVALLLGTIFCRGVRNHAKLHDRDLRVVSAAILGLLLWSLASSVKGQYLDFDPVNVYFWLLAGVLAKIPALDTSRAGGPTDHGRLP